MPDYFLGAQKSIRYWFEIPQEPHVCFEYIPYWLRGGRFLKSIFDTQVHKKSSRMVLTKTYIKDTEKWTGPSGTFHTVEGILGSDNLLSLRITLNKLESLFLSFLLQR